MHHALRFLAAGLTVPAVAALVAAPLGAVPNPHMASLDVAKGGVVWSGAITGTRIVHDATRIEETIERFRLVLAPGDYSGQEILVSIDWVDPAENYDLRVYDANGEFLVIESGSGSNGESSRLGIVPPVVESARTYFVDVAAVNVEVGGYTGSARLAEAPAPLAASFSPTPIDFSPNVTLVAPETPTDGEPSVRVDVRGNCYVGGIRGVPAGVDVWRIDLDPTSPGFDPGMRNAVYLGQPDAFAPHDPEDPTVGGSDGGGDIEISVSFPDDPEDIPVLTISSLAAANISTAISMDRGDSFTLAPATTATTADDREWNESTGFSTVYLFWRAPIPLTALWIGKSEDHGLTFPQQNFIDIGSTPGYIDVNHDTGRVFVSHSSGSAMFVSFSDDGGVNWTTRTVNNNTTHRALFDVVKVGRDGTVYGVWSNASLIYLSYSTDHGNSWTPRMLVNDPTVYRTSVMPWIEAGDAGRVAIVWYGTTTNANVDAADWHVIFSQSLNVTSPFPTFSQQVISDHEIHAGSVSLGGLGGAANRNLLDYFQVALDPQGAAVVSFADDHCDYLAHTFVTRQLNGPSLYADANGTGFVDPVTLPPPPTPNPDDPEVFDFLRDTTLGLVQPVTTDSPFDIEWVDLDCGRDALDVPVIIARIKVTDLTVVPQAGNFRVDFVANAPSGHCDRGDHFWVSANTNDPTNPTVVFGQSDRDADGGYHVRTTLGDADEVMFDTETFVITMTVAIDKLNAFVSAGPPIADGSVLEGIKADVREGTSNGGLWDHTRFGVPFQLGFCTSLVAVDPQVGPPVASFLEAPAPNPMTAAAEIRFRVARAGFVELSVFDVAGRRVRTVHAGRLPAGEHVRAWDGQTDSFGVRAAPGTYFFVLNSLGGTFRQKVTLLD